MPSIANLHKNRVTKYSYHYCCFIHNKAVSALLRNVIITESTAGTGTHFYVDDVTELHVLGKLKPK